MLFKEVKKYLSERHNQYTRSVSYVFKAVEKVVLAERYSSLDTREDIVADANSLLRTISDTFGYIPIDEYKSDLKDKSYIGDRVIVEIDNSSLGILSGKVERVTPLAAHWECNIPGILTDFIGNVFWIKIDDTDSVNNIYIMGIDTNSTLTGKPDYVVCGLDFIDAPWRGVSFCKK